MNVSRAVVPCMKLSKGLITPSVAQRFFASQPAGPVHPGYKKIKEKYAKFQVDDGTPIHIKGGAFDKLLYYTTLAGCGVGLVLTFQYYYTAAFPKKC